MSRPYMNSIKQYTETVDVFSGLDRRMRISEGRFSDMKNMSSHKYPLLSTRQKRYAVSVAGADEVSGKYTGMISKEKMCYTKGSQINMGGNWIEMGLDPYTKKQLISFGSYIIILPDKKYINYADFEDRGDIEAEFSVALDGNYTFSIGISDISGNIYSNVTASDTAPTDPANGDHWLDTSGDTDILKQYSEYSLSWVTVVSTYTRIIRAEIGSRFNAGDSVTISGIPKSSGFSYLNGSHVITAVDEDNGQFIVIPGIPEKTGNYTPGASDPVSFKRSMPYMDYVIESGNRLWGCAYAEVDGKRVNEIYASKLGDFKNWNVFEGTSMDSYAAPVGTDGKFTGAISYRGNPHFFKENTLHKVMGSTPSSYQVYTTEIEGVGEDCGRSLSVVDNILFYKSRNGVCMYDGSFPTDIGGALGRDTYADAVAGDADGRYYLWMNGKHTGLYCYDTSTGTWTMEDAPKITHFAEHHGILYCTDGDKVYSLNGTYEKDKTTEEDQFEWYAESGEIGVETNSKKYISRLLIRMRLAADARMTVKVCYDSERSWETLYEAEGGSMRVYNAYVRPRRCDHLRLRVEGRGECEIYSITKYMEYGSVL